MRTAYVIVMSLAALAFAWPAHAVGLPQLNPDTYAPQIIWLAISFAVLYVLMSRMALPRISRILEERQERIDDNLEKAAHLKTEADAAAAAYEAAIADARAQAGEILRETSQRLAASAAERHADLGERLAAEIEAAERRIAAGREEALVELRKTSAELVRRAAGRLLGEVPDAAAADAAVAATLKGRGA